jgi:hypothetical protein
MGVSVYDFSYRIVISVIESVVIPIGLLTFHFAAIIPILSRVAIVFVDHTTTFHILRPSIAVEFRRWHCRGIVLLLFKTQEMGMIN